MTYETLENLTLVQVELSNILFLQAVLETCNLSGIKADVRQGRRKQYEDLHAKLLPGSDPDDDMPQLVEKWWDEEEVWIGRQPDAIGQRLEDQLLYRALVLLFRNHNLCPFTKTVTKLFRKPYEKPDLEDFERLHSESATRFLLASIENLQERDVVHFRCLIPALKAVTEKSVHQALYSARYKLLGRDLAVLKGLVIGGVLGVSASIVMGPILGTWIGNAVGLSGAAATSFGLAFLGGGSLASGGFGMAGGSVVLGVAFGSARAAHDGLNAAADDLNIVVDARNLPILLATGRLLSQLEFAELSEWIRWRIMARGTETSQRLEKVVGDDEEAKGWRERLRTNQKLYERAFGMAKSYDWMSVYDIGRT
jgi:hypothetical protein